MNRLKSKKNTRHKNTNDPQKKYRLGTVSKNILLEGLKRFHGANLTLSSDVDQDTHMFGLHERPLDLGLYISRDQKLDFLMHFSPGDRFKKAKVQTSKMYRPNVAFWGFIL